MSFDIGSADLSENGHFEITTDFYKIFWHVGIYERIAIVGYYPISVYRPKLIRLLLNFFRKVLQEVISTFYKENRQNILKNEVFFVTWL